MLVTAPLDPGWETQATPVWASLDAFLADADGIYQGCTVGTNALVENRTAKVGLLTTRGHPFARDHFYKVFEANPDIEYSAVEHPAAQYMFNPEFARNFDCYVMYDMPGIEFNRDPNGNGMPRFSRFV